MPKKKASKPLARKQMKKAKGGLSTAGGLTDQQMTGLQPMVSQTSKTSQVTSNILAKYSQAGQSIAGNLK
jgi:hypothetical protein